MNARLETRLATQAKRANQVCKVFELKIDKSHLSKTQSEFLGRLFAEDKWFYNYCLSQKNIKDADTTIKSVPVKLGKDGVYEDRPLTNLAGQMKQAIQNRIFLSLKTLSTLKKKGKKVGWLKFKSHVESLPLKQHNVTYRLNLNQNYLLLPKLKKPIKVLGLEQIPPKAELANANLLSKHGDYFLHVTTFMDKDSDYIQEQHEINQRRKGRALGIDFGCTTQLTGMEVNKQGYKIEFGIPVSDRIKRLDRRIQKKNRKRSKNKSKDQAKRRKAYAHLTNQRKDIRNKVVSALSKNYEIICVQDENIKGWQKGGHGKKITNTGIGGIMSALKKRAHTLVEVDRFVPTTK